MQCFQSQCDLSHVELDNLLRESSVEVEKFREVSAWAVLHNQYKVLICLECVA